MKIIDFFKKFFHKIAKWFKDQEDSFEKRVSSPSQPTAPPSTPKPNSNFNTRPGGVDMIIIHANSLYVNVDGEKMRGEDYIASLGLSYHGLVEPSGHVITAVPREKRAWHAGRSKWGNETNLNDNSIGFSAMIDYEPLGYEGFRKAMERPGTYTDGHYSSLAFLCYQAMKTYSGITYDRILRHSDVSGPTVRSDPKHDPGAGFDMDRLKNEIKRLFNAY